MDPAENGVVRRTPHQILITNILPRLPREEANFIAADLCPRSRKPYCPFAFVVTDRHPSLACKIIEVPEFELHLRHRKT
jgi:hypothetical protein